MKSPKLQNGDLVIENNDLILISDDEELIQSVRNTLLTRKGEFFLDPEEGVSHDNLLGKGTSDEEARDDIIEALSRDERIQAVTDIMFTDNLETRRRQVSLTIQKQDDTELTIDEVELNA